MKYVFFLLIFYCIHFDITAQKCTMVFRTQDDMTVRIYKPIDDTFNDSYVSDKLDLKPNISISYELDVNDFEFVMCRFSNGDRREILLFPGDSIVIYCESQKITISGSNSEGQNYYNKNYVDKGLGYFDLKIDTIFNQYITNNVIKYDSINYYFRKELIIPYQNDLKKMEMSGSITPKFSSILSKNLYFGCCSLLSICYGNMARANSKLDREDYKIFLAQLSQFFETPYALSDDSKKMPDNFILSYYEIKSFFYDDAAKIKLLGGYDRDTFGGYPYYLLASDSIQLREYSTLFIQDLQNGTNYFNHEKMLTYLSNKFPNSEYVAIIKRMMKQSQTKEKDNDIIIVNDSISSIEELMQIPGIKGKYAYIDLWETACVPCVFEFQYNEDIHAILAQYNNIVPVYISIDTNRELWESRVKKFNLNGYNIMASKSLNEDIGTKVYKAKQVGSIPRFLLLDPEGTIVKDNLPRPSKSAQLKPILFSVLK